MKKIYTYFGLFFIGSLLPFLIVEFYFQDYFTIGLIGIFAVIVFILCISIDYLKGKNIVKRDFLLKKIDYIDWVQKKEQNKIPSNYFFRKNLY